MFIASKSSQRHLYKSFAVVFPNKLHKMNLIVFDIDDTLTKSECQHQLAYVNALKEIGITEINQNWKDYQHHTDSYILIVNYENNFADKFDWNLINNFENELKILNLLHRLDKYRWAEGQGISSIQEYTEKIKKTFDGINKEY